MNIQSLRIHFPGVGNSRLSQTSFIGIPKKIHNSSSSSSPFRFFAVYKGNKMSKLHEKAVSNVTFSVDNAKDCPGYLSPNGKDSKMGVVVMQEWWGMNKTIQGVADTFGSKGFKALVPDLYRGKVASDREQAGHFMSGLDFPGAVNDIRGAAKYLLAGGCHKVGVVGFCMGGALSILAAVNIPEISVSVCYHGIPDVSAWDAHKIKIPIQFHFGNKDKEVGFSDAETANKLEKKIKDAGVHHEFYRYETDHAFTNVDRPEVYDAKAAEQAWTRTFAFFNKNLS